jgi:hypothetical protein
MFLSFLCKVPHYFSQQLEGARKEMRQLKIFPITQITMQKLKSFNEKV